jgi:transcriptional regulator of acetoin/glycerol metabolism
VTVVGKRKGKLAEIVPLTTDQSLNPFVAKEREAILEALSANNWSIQKAAKALRINRTTLWRKMKRNGIALEKKGVAKERVF